MIAYSRCCSFCSFSSEFEIISIPLLDSYLLCCISALCGQSVLLPWWPLKSSIWSVLEGLMPCSSSVSNSPNLTWNVHRHDVCSNFSALQVLFCPKRDSSVTGGCGLSQLRCPTKWFLLLFLVFRSPKVFSLFYRTPLTCNNPPPQASISHSFPWTYVL